MFDDVKCELPLPDDRLTPGRWFQTKSLYCGMDRFTITCQGRLIHHPCRYESAGEHELQPGLFSPQFDRVPSADVDMDYHGDIRMYGADADGTWVDYVVRFTHGVVEWIRPYEELSETHKTWFYSKG